MLSIIVWLALWSLNGSNKVKKFFNPATNTDLNVENEQCQIQSNVHTKNVSLAMPDLSFIVFRCLSGFVHSCVRFAYHNIFFVDHYAENSNSCKRIWCYTSIHCIIFSELFVNIFQCIHFVMLNIVYVVYSYVHIFLHSCFLWRIGFY